LDKSQNPILAAATEPAPQTPVAVFPLGFQRKIRGAVHTVDLMKNPPRHSHGGFKEKSTGLFARWIPLVMI
jgi:hypothetical protein